MAEENSKLMAHEIMFASSLRAAGAHTSNIVASYTTKGGIFYLDITAEGGTATLDVKLQGLDQISGDWFDLADNVVGTGAYAFAQASAVTTGPTVLAVYPGLTASGNAVCTGILPAVFRAHATVAGSSTPTMTFSLGVDLIK
jgi:hypothetical protein|tara:strand:- start:22 stop:447 length:426 start_codon:yes stop_codon:yes gene_type:complete